MRNDNPAKSGMQLLEKGDPSIAIVRKALPQMSRHGIPITPANYAVWFEYLHSDNPALKGEMDTALENGRISTAMIEDLYERYIDGGDPALLARAREGLRALVGTLRDKIAEASNRLSGYGNSLEDFAEQLSAEIPADDLAAFVEVLAQKTGFIVAQNAALQAELETVSADVGSLHAQLENSREEAMTDPLTGLRTRRAFAEAFASVVAEALDKDTHRPCLMLLDVDQFMEVTAKRGSEAGERILREIATALGRNIKGRDVVSRFDGDRFAVLLTDMPSSAAPRVAEQLRRAVAALEIASGSASKPIRVTCSMGVAWFRKGESIDELIDRAETVVFLSKEAGRNRVTIDD